MKNGLKPQKLICCLVLTLALFCAACGAETADSMRLLRTEGSVDVQNEDGKAIAATENMGLYNGFQLGTKIASYAWIELDKVKLAKMDENSKIEIQKEGRDLTIQLQEGSIFFQVTEPLENDETMQIRTSTMAVGIRGTCGWVSTYGNKVTVGLLEGKVECSSADGKTVVVEAGWKAIMTSDGEITVIPLIKEDIPAFIRGEADSLLEAVPVSSSEPPENQDGADNTDNADNGESGEETDRQEVSNPYQLPPELDDGIERTVVEVGTRQELIALRNTDLSNTEIHLTAELYELGDSTFSVFNAVNLRIIGGPNTRISGGKNGAGSIFFASGCENLMLYQIEFGNDTDGEMDECASLYRCSAVQIDSCVFYSGMYGIHGDVCDAVVSNSQVRSCGEGGLLWRDGSVMLDNCTFSDNGGSSTRYDNSPMFQLTNAPLQLNNCSLYNNTCVNYTGSKLQKDIQGNFVWVPDESTVTESGTISEGNLWNEDNT